MARLIAFVGLVALGVAGALFLISERSAVTGAGYRVARLEAERRERVEANRKLEAQIAAAKTPRALVEKVRDLQLDLVPPDLWVDEQVEREKEKSNAGDTLSRAKKGR